jgi:hypothetical protein
MVDEAMQGEGKGEGIGGEEGGASDYGDDL